MTEFQLKQWPGKTFQVNEGSSYTNNRGVRQVVVQVMTEKGWKDFSRLPESELNEMRGISQASDDLCVRCEAEPVTWDKGHPDYCDSCWNAQALPKRAMTLFKGKVKDLATADLSGGWRGPGNYQVTVKGLPRVIRCESMCDLVAVMSESPGALVRFLEVVK